MTNRSSDLLHFNQATQNYDTATSTTVNEDEPNLTVTLLLTNGIAPKDIDFSFEDEERTQEQNYAVADVDYNKTGSIENIVYRFDIGNFVQDVTLNNLIINDPYYDEGTEAFDLGFPEGNAQVEISSAPGFRARIVSDLRVLINDDEDIVTGAQEPAVQPPREDVTAPVIIGIRPEEGVIAGERLHIYLDFNENVIVDTTEGTPTLNFGLGSTTVTANYEYASQNTLVFGYKTAITNQDEALINDFTLNLNSATIGDESSNAWDLTDITGGVTASGLASIENFIVDVTASTVTFTLPSTSLLSVFASDPGDVGPIFDLARVEQGAQAGDVLHFYLDFSENVLIDIGTAGTPPLIEFTLDDSDSNTVDSRTADYQVTASNTLIFAYHTQPEDVGQIGATIHFDVRDAIITDNKGNTLQPTNLGTIDGTIYRDLPLLSPPAITAPTTTDIEAPELLTLRVQQDAQAGERIYFYMDFSEPVLVRTDLGDDLPYITFGLPDPTDPSTLTLKTAYYETTSGNTVLFSYQTELTDTGVIDNDLNTAGQQVNYTDPTAANDPAIDSIITDLAGNTATIASTVFALQAQPSGAAEISASTSGVPTDTTPPTIRNVRVQQDVIVGQPLEIYLDFDEIITFNLNPNQVPNITFTLDDGDAATQDQRTAYFRYTTGNTAIFTYQTQTTDGGDIALALTLNLNGATINDLANNVFAGSTSLTATTAAIITPVPTDTTPPTFNTVRTESTVPLGESLEFYLDFDENIIVDTTNNLPTINFTLEDNNGNSDEKIAEFRYTSGSTAIFSYQTREDDVEKTTGTTVTINNLVLTDQTGNEITLNNQGETLANTAFIFIERERPTLVENNEAPLITALRVQTRASTITEAAGETLEYYLDFSEDIQVTLPSDPTTVTISPRFTNVANATAERTAVYNRTEDNTLVFTYTTTADDLRPDPLDPIPRVLSSNDRNQGHVLAFIAEDGSTIAGLEIRDQAGNLFQIENSATTLGNIHFTPSSQYVISPSNAPPIFGIDLSKPEILAVRIEENAVIGETLDFYVDLTAPVTYVDGSTPGRLIFQIADNDGDITNNARNATYNRTVDNSLIFSYPLERVGDEGVIDVAIMLNIGDSTITSLSNIVATTGTTANPPSILQNTDIGYNLVNGPLTLATPSSETGSGPGSGSGTAATIPIDTIAPTLIGVNSQQGTFGIGERIVFFARFNEAIRVTSENIVPSLNITRGTTTDEVATFLEASGNALLFEYQVPIDAVNGETIVATDLVLPSNVIIADYSSAPAGGNVYAETDFVDISTLYTDTITITNVVDTTLPVCDYIATPGTYNFDDTLEFIVTCNESVSFTTGDIGASVTLDNAEGGNEQLELSYQGGEYTNNLRFTYIITENLTLSDTVAQFSTFTISPSLEDSANNALTSTVLDRQATQPSDVIINGAKNQGITGCSVRFGEGVYGLGDTLPITITCDRTLNFIDATEQDLTFILDEGDGDTNNDERTAEYQGGAGTSTLQYSYIITEADGDESSITQVTLPSLRDEEDTIITTATLRDVGTQSQLITVEETTGVLIYAVAPTITAIELADSAQTELSVGESLNINVTFDKQVTVTDNPQLNVRIDERIVSATLLSTEDAGTPLSTTLTFTYFIEDVVFGDVIIPANPIQGGDISASIGGTPADVTFAETDLSISINDPAVPDNRKVTPPSPGLYKQGDVLTFAIQYDEPVTVDAAIGEVRFPFTIGGEARRADYTATILQQIIQLVIEQ